MVSKYTPRCQNPLLLSTTSTASPIPGQYVRHDVIHKTGNTQPIATPPEENRVTDIGNTQKKFGGDRACSFGVMLAGRQTNKQTDTVITILRTDIGGGVVTTTTHIRGDLICNLQHHTSSESFSYQRAFEVQLAQAICAEMTAGVTSRPSPVVFST